MTSSDALFGGAMMIFMIFFVSVVAFLAVVSEDPSLIHRFFRERHQRRLELMRERRALLEAEAKKDSKQ